MSEHIISEVQTTTDQKPAMSNKVKYLIKSLVVANSQLNDISVFLFGCPPVHPDLTESTCMIEDINRACELADVVNDRLDQIKEGVGFYDQIRRSENAC